MKTIVENERKSANWKLYDKPSVSSRCVNLIIFIVLVTDERICDRWKNRIRTATNAFHNLSKYSDRNIPFKRLPKHYVIFNLLYFPRSFAAEPNFTLRTNDSKMLWILSTKKRIIITRKKEMAFRRYLKKSKIYFPAHSVWRNHD